MRFNIINLGCKVNRVESDDLAVTFLEYGITPSEGEEADIVVINTCTVTGEAEKKTRKAVRRALRENPAALVTVTGCAAVLDKHAFEEMDERVYVETDKSALAESVFKEYATRFGTEGIQEHTRPEKRSLLRIGSRFPSRAGIKIQDGCNNACTYCIVHVARGQAWSRSWQAVVEEAVAFEQEGVQELVLTGINIGSYNDEGLDLTGLLHKLLSETERVRYRISSIEPGNITDNLIRIISEADGRICRHLHLPLQSGSTRVLHKMARPYTAAQYCKLVDKLFEAIPVLSLSTDIIVGFPGESEEDFQQTLSVADHCRFSKIHIFPYSRRNGTPAASRTDQVEPATKAQRVEVLSGVGEALREQAYSRRIGSVEKVLVETGDVGTTESYFMVTVPKNARQGELISMLLDEKNHVNAAMR